MIRKVCIFLLFSLLVASTYADLAFPEYPESLTEKEWDQAIEIEDVDGEEDDQAREDEETVGDLLKNIQKLHKAIQLKDFDPLVKQGLKNWNFRSLAEFETTAMSNAQNKPKKLRAKVKLLTKELKKLKKSWNKNNAISKDDKKDLAATIKALATFFDQIKFKGKKGLKKRLTKIFKDTRKRLARRSKVAWVGINNVRETIKKDKATMTREAYDNFIADKVPVTKKAIALIFGEDSDHCKNFDQVAIAVDNDDEIQTQADKIEAVLNNIILDKILQNTGLE